MDTEMKIIFTPTIQHTGTWFLNDILFRHSQVKRIVELANFFLKPIDLQPYPERMEGGSELYHDGVNVVTSHFHFFEGHRDLCSGDFRPSDDEETNWPKGGYYLGKYHRSMIEFFDAVFPTVVPVRDPLVAILSAHAKKGFKYQNEHVVREFKYIARMENAFFLPIDLEQSRHDRAIKLQRLLMHCGLDIESYIGTIADEWQPVNSRSSENNLRQVYASKGITKQIKSVPGVMSLLGAEPVIRPFLESLGYESLPWWS